MINMNIKYKIISIVAAVLLTTFIGLAYLFGGFGRSDWIGPVAVSEPRIDKTIVRELVENQASIDRLRSVLGEPSFEFIASETKVQIYRSVTEYTGGTRTLFGMIDLGDDYTSIEEIWVIEIANDRVSAYERIKRVYYPVQAKDVAFGLDRSAYDQRGYWIHNQLPNSK